MRAMRIAFGERIMVFAHVRIDDVVIAEHIAAPAIHDGGVAGLADDVVLDQVLGIPELQEHRIRFAAVMAITVVEVATVDFATVHVRQVHVRAVYCHVAFHVGHPTVRAGFHVNVLENNPCTRRGGSLQA